MRGVNVIKLIAHSDVDIALKAAAVCHNKKDKVSLVMLKKIIEAGHLSILEHISCTFMLTCSRKVLAQITRHRHLSFTVQSSRVSELNAVYEPFKKDPFAHKLMDVYHHLAGQDTELASYFMPEMAMCCMVVTGNLRTWLEMLPKRLCKRALPEFRDIAKEIASILMDTYPFLNITAPCKYCNEWGCDFHAKRKN